MKYIILAGILISVAIDIQAQSPDKYLLKAGMLVEMKNYEEALSAISASQSNVNSKYYKYLADIYYGLKNFDKSVENYLKAEQAASESYPVELAKCFANLGNKAKAIEYLNSYYQSTNKLPISKIVNDEAFLNYKTDPEWQSMLQNANYSDEEIKANQVNSAAELGYNEYFESVLNQSILKYPTNSVLLYHQSKLQENQKFYDASLLAIKQAIAQKPNNDLYYYQQASILQKNNKTTEALISINKAIELNPFNLAYYIKRIELNQLTGNIEKVNDDVALVEFCAENTPEVQLIKIQEEIDKQNYFTALTGINNLIQKDNTKGKYYVVRGNIYIKAQKYSNADNDFGMALDLNPSDDEANLGKGTAKFKLEDKSAACYYWQKAANKGNREAIDNLNKYCGKN